MCLVNKNKPNDNCFLIVPTENCEIIVTDVERDEFTFARTGLTQIWYRWPNNTVVYNMDTPPFEQSDKDLVEHSLKQIEEVTCVKFVKRTDEDYFVNLTVITFRKK